MMHRRPGLLPICKAGNYPRAIFVGSILVALARFSFLTFDYQKGCVSDAAEDFKQFFRSE